MATQVDIVDLDDGHATLQVQYGRGKKAHIRITLPEPAYERQLPAEICRFEVHELVDALDEWVQQSDSDVGHLPER